MHAASESMTHRLMMVILGKAFTWYVVRASIQVCTHTTTHTHTRAHKRKRVCVCVRASVCLRVSVTARCTPAQPPPSLPHLSNIPASLPRRLRRKRVLLLGALHQRRIAYQGRKRLCGERGGGGESAQTHTFDHDLGLCLSLSRSRIPVSSSLVELQPSYQPPAIAPLSEKGDENDRCSHDPAH